MSNKISNEQEKRYVQCFQVEELTHLVWLHIIKITFPQSEGHYGTRGKTDELKGFFLSHFLNFFAKILKMLSKITNYHLNIFGTSIFITLHPIGSILRKSTGVPHDIKCSHTRTKNTSIEKFFKSTYEFWKYFWNSYIETHFDENFYKASYYCSSSWRFYDRRCDIAN